MRLFTFVALTCCAALGHALSSYNYHQEESANDYIMQDQLARSKQQYELESSITKEDPFAHFVRKLEESREVEGGLVSIAEQAQLGESGDCTNKMCDFFYYFLTCHEFGIHMDKICASYFVGWLFQGSDYPPKSDISNAPSVCLGQFAEKALPFISNPLPYFSNIVFDEPYKQVCRYNCYQNYVRSATLMLNTCYNQLLPNLLKLYTFNTLYGLNCAENAKLDNCYDSLLSIIESAPTAAPSAGPQPPNPNLPFNNYNCTLNPAMQTYCPLFKSQQCCFANQVAIVEQTPKAANESVLLPPCVARYLNVTCPEVTLSADLCTNGTNSATSILSGSVSLSIPPPNLPNMYNQSSVLHLQGAIAAAIMQNTGVSFQMANALNVEITNYLYFDADGLQLTTADGVNAPDWADYWGAAKGNFYFNVVQVYLSEADSQANAAFLASAGFAQVMSAAYGTTASTSFASQYYYPAEQFDTTHSAAAPMVTSSGTAALVVLSTAAALLGAAAMGGL